MKRIQEQIVNSWKAKGLDLTDTSKMHRMADDALNTVLRTPAGEQINISWWVVVIVVAIATIVSWTLIYLAVNPQFNSL